MMGLIGIEHPYPGDSVVELDPAEDRVRRVVFVTDPSARQPVVNRWLVRGTMSDSTSWRELEPRIVEHRIRDYAWGTVLRFGIAHAGDVYLTSGWSTTSPSYTWSNGNSAEITFGITPPQRDVTIRMVFFVYLAPGKVDRQRIRVSANGESMPNISALI